MSKRHSVLLGLAGVAAAIASPAASQEAKDVQSIRQAYGARLTTVSPDEPTKPTARLSTRLNNRVNNRVALRIERFNVAANPIAALRTAPDDGSRQTTRIAPVPQDDGPQ